MRDHQKRPDSLPGGTAIWVFVVVELVTFGLFFLAFAHSYAGDIEVFASSQKLLHPMSGLINTGVLLTGSWLVARAAHARELGRDTSNWFWATALAGCLFVGIKIHEYVDVFGQGINMSTNLFWFFYLFLTVIHLLHVVAGIGLAAFMAVMTRTSPKPEPEDREGTQEEQMARAEVSRTLDIEATATYWHLVDLIWIILFPLIYLAS